MWVRVSLFGGVFEAKVDLATFSFQVPAEVSSADGCACEAIATRDSTDAMVSVFRANIDSSPRLITAVGLPPAALVYAPPMCVVSSRRLHAPSPGAPGSMVHP